LRQLRPLSLNKAFAAGAAFAALTGLVWTGVFTSFDRYAVRHWMPWARFGPHHLIQVGSAFKPDIRPTAGGTVISLWTYPASPFVSALIVLVCAWALPRRDAVAAISLWLVANGIELIGKLIVSRPSVGQPGFTDSFPSGHAVRAFVVAAVVAWTWRRVALPAYAWALGVCVALVVLGAHVPTDVIGGALLAATLLGTTHARSAVSADSVT
jgi:membrane-associated phospholipid phosphatase